MTIGEELGKAAEIVAPEIGVPVLVAKIIGAIAIVALGGFVIWQVFFAGHAAQVKHDEAAARASGMVGDAEGGAGAHAANVVAGNSTKETIIHETTRDHYAEITKQPGASDPVSVPVWNAFERSVCMRASAASLPDCQRLPEAGP